jgi:hypothetical protein
VDLVANMLLFCFYKLVVNDVHFRYEDNILDPENPFAVGITIEKLAMESANENWVRKHFVLKYNLKHAVFYQV